MVKRKIKPSKSVNVSFVGKYVENANSFENLNNLRITGTKTEFDGQAIPLFMFNTEVGKAIKTNYAFPSQFAVSAHLFSNTLIRFDNTNLTFDDTTP